MKRIILFGLVGLTLLIGLPKIASAIPDDYIDETLVYSTLNKGELELEYRFDYGRDRDDNEHFMAHTFGLEYGITNRWMIDGSISIEHDSADGTVFDSGRLETRYRITEENESPVDIALSGEFNIERDDDGKLIPAFEPRLILSKDIDNFNLTLNLPVEIPLREGHPEFIPALGTSYKIAKMVRLGTEIKYGTDSHEGAVIPQVFLYFPHDITAKLGYSHGFSDNHVDFGRLSLEFEF